MKMYGLLKPDNPNSEAGMRGRWSCVENDFSSFSFSIVLCPGEKRRHDAALPNAMSGRALLQGSSWPRLARLQVGLSPTAPMT
jgi:hypothetical protein